MQGFETAQRTETQGDWGSKVVFRQNQMFEKWKFAQTGVNLARQVHVGQVNRNHSAGLVFAGDSGPVGTIRANPAGQALARVLDQ